jgi:hypothetical protein
VREIATGRQGKATPQTKFRRTIKTLVKRNGELLVVYNKAQRLEKMSASRRRP